MNRKCVFLGGGVLIFIAILIIGGLGLNKPASNESVKTDLKRDYYAYVKAEGSKKAFNPIVVQTFADEPKGSYQVVKLGDKEVKDYLDKEKSSITIDGVNYQKDHNLPIIAIDQNTKVMHLEANPGTEITYLDRLDNEYKTQKFDQSGKLALSDLNKLFINNIDADNVLVYDTAKLKDETFNSFIYNAKQGSIISYKSNITLKDEDKITLTSMKDLTFANLKDIAAKKVIDKVETAKAEPAKPATPATSPNPTSEVKPVYPRVASKPSLKPFVPVPLTPTVPPAPVVPPVPVVPPTPVVPPKPDGGNKEPEKVIVAPTFKALSLDNNVYEKNSTMSIFLEIENPSATNLKNATINQNGKTVELPIVKSDGKNVVKMNVGSTASKNVDDQSISLVGFTYDSEKGKDLPVTIEKVQNYLYSVNTELPDLKQAKITTSDITTSTFDTTSTFVDADNVIVKDSVKLLVIDNNGATVASYPITTGKLEKVTGLKAKNQYTVNLVASVKQIVRKEQELTLATTKVTTASAGDVNIDEMQIRVATPTQMAITGLKTSKTQGLVLNSGKVILKDSKTSQLKEIPLGSNELKNINDGTVIPFIVLDNLTSNTTYDISFEFIDSLGNVITGENKTSNKQATTDKVTPKIDAAKSGPTRIDPNRADFHLYKKNETITLNLVLDNPDDTEVTSVNISPRVSVLTGDMAPPIEVKTTKVDKNKYTIEVPSGTVASPKAPSIVQDNYFAVILSYKYIPSSVSGTPEKTIALVGDEMVGLRYLVEKTLPTELTSKILVSNVTDSSLHAKVYFEDPDKTIIDGSTKLLVKDPNGAVVKEVIVKGNAGSEIDLGVIDSLTKGTTYKLELVSILSTIEHEHTKEKPNSNTTIATKDIVVSASTTPTLSFANFFNLFSR